MVRYRNLHHPTFSTARLILRLSTHHLPFLCLCPCICGLGLSCLTFLRLILRCWLHRRSFVAENSLLYSSSNTNHAQRLHRIRSWPSVSQPRLLAGEPPTRPPSPRPLWTFHLHLPNSKKMIPRNGYSSPRPPIRTRPRRTRRARREDLALVTLAPLVLQLAQQLVLMARQMQRIP